MTHETRMFHQRAATKAIRALMNYCFKRPTPQPMTVSQKGIQARAIRHLIAHGNITAWDIIKLGTTDAHKMLTRMRRMGLLYEANDPHGHRLKPNATGHGKHRVHYWTRKMPESWLKPTAERRKVKRGGKV